MANINNSTSGSTHNQIDSQNPKVSPVGNTRKSNVVIGSARKAYHDAKKMENITSQLVQTAPPASPPPTKKIVATKSTLTAQNIEEQVLPVILKRFLKFPVLGDHLVSKKHDLGIREASLREIISHASQKLATVKFGEGVVIKKGESHFYVKLRYNKNNELRLVIQKYNNKQIDAGGFGTISEATAIHTGKSTVKKEDINPLDTFGVHDEHVILSQIYDALLTLFKDFPEIKNTLPIISPDHTEEFLPIIKRSSAPIQDGDRIKGMFIERAPHGGLVEYIGRCGGLSIPCMAQFAIDLLTAVYLLEKIGFFHFDIKPDNIVVFNQKADPENEVKRFKLVDFAFGKKALTSANENTGMISIEQGTAKYVDVHTLMTGIHLNSNDLSAEDMNKRLHRRDRVAAARSILFVFYNTPAYRKRIIQTSNKEIFDLKVNFPISHSLFKRAYEGLTQSDPDRYFITHAIDTFIKIRNSGGMM